MGRQTVGSVMEPSHADMDTEQARPSSLLHTTDRMNRDGKFEV
jgi:hypothetical protein